MPLMLRRWKARPRSGSCSPLSRSSWWDWKSGSPAAGTSHPRAGAPGQPLQPEPSSAPAVGLGAEASPLLSPRSLPCSQGKEQLVCGWCGSCRLRASAPRCLPPPRRCRRSLPLARGPASHGKWAGVGGGMYPPPAPSRYTLTMVVRPRARVGRGKDAGRACQGGLGRAGGPLIFPLCIQLCSLQLSPAPALAAGSRVGGPEPIQQQRQEPSTSCRCTAPSLTSTPASVSLPGRGLKAEPGPGASSNHRRDLMEKPPGEKPLKQGISPSPNTEIPLSQRCSWEVG